MSTCEEYPQISTALFYETFEKDGDIDPWEYSNENNVLFTWGIMASDYYYYDNDLMLQFENEGLHIEGKASVNTKINHTISLKDKYLVLQYKSIIPKKGVCSYGCISLFSGEDKDNIQEIVRFGPGICRKDANDNSNYKIFFNINNVPIVEEQAVEFDLNNLKTHIYTLIIEPNGEYKIFIDCKSFKTGNFTDSQKLTINNAPAIKRVGFRNYNSDQNGDSPYYFNNIYINQEDSDPLDLCLKELNQSLLVEIPKPVDIEATTSEDSSSKKSSSKKSSIGLIVGIVIGCVVVIAGVGVFLFIKFRKSAQNEKDDAVVSF